MNSDEEAQLEEEAAELLIRLSSDPANSVTRALIRTWRSRSALHARVWDRAADAFHFSGEILRGSECRVPAASRLTRRRVILGGAGGLAVASLAAVALPSLILQARADHVTGTAELERITLPDGSVATLGPDSALALGFSETRRDLQLLAGMAFFEVVSDPARPFRVNRDGLTAQALGTGFSVEDDDGALTVAVEHGRVGVKIDDRPAGELEEGEWLRWSPATDAITRGRRAATQQAVWRDRFVLAEDEPVESVVRRLDRWQQGTVIVADGSLGRERVSGIFDASRPREALEALVAPFGGKVHTATPYVTVITSF